MCTLLVALRILPETILQYSGSMLFIQNLLFLHFKDLPHVYVIL